MDTKLKQFIITVLRRASYKWKPRNVVYAAARVARGMYKCNLCANTFSRKEVVMDHKNPVVSPQHGFQGFDIYIERMFVDESGWQCICKTCHDSKTDEERVIRQVNKKKLSNKLTIKRKRSRVK